MTLKTLFTWDRGYVPVFLNKKHFKFCNACQIAFYCNCWCDGFFCPVDLS